MSAWGDFCDFCEDVGDVAIEAVEIAGDVCEVAGPIVMCVNPAIGEGMCDFAKYERMAEPYLEKAQAKLNEDDKPQQVQSPAPEVQEVQPGSTGHGKLSDEALNQLFDSSDDLGITGDESVEELLAKIFGKQVKDQRDKLTSLAKSDNQDTTQKNLDIQAAAFDLQTIVGAASKTLGAVGEAQNTALGRTN